MCVHAMLFAKNTDKDDDEDDDDDELPYVDRKTTWINDVGILILRSWKEKEWISEIEPNRDLCTVGSMYVNCIRSHHRSSIQCIDTKKKRSKTINSNMERERRTESLVHQNAHLVHIHNTYIRAHTQYYSKHTIIYYIFVSTYLVKFANENKQTKMNKNRIPLV